MLENERIRGMQEAVAEACLKMTCIFTCDPSDADVVVFSGVFYKKDEGHYYILTAKHCLEGIRRPDTITLSNFGAQTLNAQFVWLKDVEVRNNLAKTDIDIAIIELASDYAKKLNAQWVSRDRIPETIALNAPVYVVGFPKEMLKRNPVDKRFIHPAPFAAFSMVAETPESESSLNPIDTNVDFFVFYDKAGPGPRPDPKGMSGCGIFTFNSIPSTPEELWIPNTRLLGILSALFPGNLLRGKKASFALPTIDEMYG